MATNKHHVIIDESIYASIAKRKAPTHPVDRWDGPPFTAPGRDAHRAKSVSFSHIVIGDPRRQEPSIVRARQCLTNTVISPPFPPSTNRLTYR